MNKIYSTNNKPLFDYIQGLYMPTNDMITVARLNMLGYYRGDAYVIVKYTMHQGGFSSTWLKRGFFPRDKTVSKEEQEYSDQIQASLVRLMDAEISNAFWYMHGIGDQHYRLADNRAVLFIKCKDGIIGAGWYENQGSKRKALRMCGFLLYALGMINERNDATLWSAAVEYLPDDANLMRDASQAAAIVRSSVKQGKLDQPFGGLQIGGD